MDTARDALPEDITALKEALASERAKALEIAAELAVVRAKASEDSALIAQQKLQIAKLQRQIYGQRSERSSRLVDQLALTFEELESSATEDEPAAEKAVAMTTTVRAFTRTRPERNTFPDHLPRERVVIDPPAACQCCGGNRLRKLGEDVTRTLEVIPRQWKVVETVREKFTCRDCEKISQAPAPFHVIPRGWAGPSLLAMLLYEKFGQHQPLNRQTERYALEGVPISLSTAADAVGACCTVLEPLLRLLEAHVMAAERLHGDDTTVPVLALGKCDVARCWVYVKDDRPFGGSDPPAAMFYYSRDRRGEHPQAHLANYSGILQADAFGGYTKLYEPSQVLGLSGKRPVGFMPGARSSPWRIWRKTRDVRLLARRRSPSRRLRSRSCAASTPCSQSSARSMAKAPTTERLSARRRARRWLPICKPICASSAPSSPAVTTWQRP
jgi:transposase